MSQASDYAGLKARIAEAGLLKRQPGFYIVVLITNTILLTLCLAMLALFTNPWLRALDAVVLGVISGQLGFQLHDSGHNQMFERKWKNKLIGIITGDVLLGMSYGWWVDKHNRHHGQPNHVDLDPDISIGVIAYNRDQLPAKRGVLRFIAAYQAYLFFPLLFGLAWSMHVTGVKFLLEKRSRLHNTELVVLALHAVLYVALLVALVGPLQAVMVMVIQKCVGGFYLAAVFAPNHKGMPQIEEGQTLDFLRSQVLTSRNVRSHPATDVLYGALNYQVEHHLFPGMARNKVKKAQSIVRDYCAELGVPYYETSILQSYREILSYLHEVGEPLRRRGRRQVEAVEAGS